MLLGHKIYIFILFSAAIISETMATMMIKETEQFTKLVPSSLSIIGYIISTYFLSIIVKTIPVGIAYAIWSAFGVVLICLLGAILKKEYLDFAALSGIFLIVAGVLIIYIFSNSEK